MILPLTHERMTVQRLPWITIGIIALNVLVFLFTWPHASRDQEKLWQVIDEIEEFGAVHPGIVHEDFDSPETLERYKQLVARFEQVNRDSLFGRYGFVPARQQWADILSSIFLHAGWLHLIGNMYLLWLCGCSVEDVWGRPLYTLFYASSGVVAAMSHAWAFPVSQAHLVGASGAIAGLMGAFLIRFYSTRIRFFFWYWIHFGTFFAPAWIMLPLWLFSQVSFALIYGENTPVAFWAHIGGFVFGVAAALFIKVTLVEEAFLVPALEEKTNLFTQHAEVKAALACIETGRHPESIRHLQTALRDDPDDIDALHLLAQSHRGMGQRAEAANVLRRKLKVHLRQREKDLAIDTYFDMIEANPDTSLSPREVLSLAPALAQCEQHQEAVQLYRGVLDSGAEPLFKLKASFALADLYVQDYKGHLALEVLKSVAPLAESLPDWKVHIQEKMKSIRTTSAAPLRQA